VAIWYIFPHFGLLCQEKSGNPDLQELKPKLCLLEKSKDGLTVVFYGRHMANFEKNNVSDPTLKPWLEPTCCDAIWTSQEASASQGDQIGGIIAPLV
jgi:hypothetical protein